MSKRSIAPDHTVIRYVSWTKVRKDNDDNPVGILGTAYSLRAGEEYLSTSWVEYFEDGTWDEKFCLTVNAIRQSSIKVGNKSAFAYASVGAIDKFMQERSVRVRFVHEAEDDNPSHAALRRWPRDNADLFEILAEDVWSSYRMNFDIPA